MSGLVAEVHIPKMMSYYITSIHFVFLFMNLCFLQNHFVKETYRKRCMNEGGLYFRLHVMALTILTLIYLMNEFCASSFSKKKDSMLKKDR